MFDILPTVVREISPFANNFDGRFLSDFRVSPYAHILVYTKLSLSHNMES